MPAFDFDKVDEYVQSEGQISFLKLEDHNWRAKVRFMYGPGETFQGYSVHNISTDPKKPKYVPCIRELGQPIETCPLCKSGSAVAAQFYIPLFVISITKCINGVEQPEEMINQTMLFQRGKTFSGALSSAVRQSAGTPLVNNVFNIVRNGKKGDTQTTYLLEFVNRDNVTLEELPPRVEAYGSYVLPEMNFTKMSELLASGNQAVTPRSTIAANVQTSTAQTGLYQGTINTKNGVPF